MAKTCVARRDGSDWRGPWVFALGRYGLRFYWDGWGCWRQWNVRAGSARLGPLSVLWWTQRTQAEG